MRKFFLAALFLLLPLGDVHAQVFGQNQVIIGPYGGGVVVSTSTTGTRKLEATSTIQNLTITNATSSIFSIGTSLNFNGVTGSTWSAFCTAITGGAGLCDGSDDGGGSGFSTTSANFWESTFGNWNLIGSYLTPTTTKGIIVASSTIGDGVNGLTVSGRATTTGITQVLIDTANGSLPASLPAFFVSSAALNSAGFLRSSNNDASGPTVIGFRSAGTAASPTAVGINDELLELTGRGYDGSTWSTASKAAVRMSAAQNWGTTAHGTYLTFGTTRNDTTTEVEGLRLTDRGSISIGTTTPYATTTIWGAGIGRAFEIVLGGLGINASTTLFFAGPGGATTTGFAATTLAGCDTIDTDAQGNFKCGTDNASAGSGSGTVATSSVEVAEQVAFFTTNGASPALISGDTGFTFNAAGDRLTVTNASTTRLSINNWAVSTTTTVCEVGCQFNSIQAALDFLPAGGGTITVKNGAYSVSQLLIKQNNTKLIAESQGAIVTCSSSPCVDYNSTGLVHTRVQGFKFVNGGASYTGIGIDTSGALIANIEDNWFDGFATSSSAVDGALNSTFYNEYKNNRMTTTNTCYSFTGAANNNNVIGGRCAPHQANGTRAFGVYVDGATHNVNLFGVNVEPNGGVGASTTAVYVGGASHDILISGGHYENMLYGVDISADSFNVKIESPYFYSTHTDAWGVCARAGSTGNFVDTSFITMTAGTKFCSEAVGLMAYSPSNRTWLGIGTTTAKGTNANLSLSGSYSTALDPLMWIQNNGAFAAAYSGIGFGNETGGFTNGLGKIGFEPGSGYTDAKFMVHVADSAKALQERLRINVRGWFGLGTSTPYARLTVWGDSTDTTYLEVANTASTTIFKAGPGGATTTGLAVSSLSGCDTIDTDANGNFRCGTDSSGGAGTGSNWAFVTAQDAIRPTTTVGIIVNGASSTINNVRINFATTTNASTTNLSLVNPLAVSSGGTGQSSFPTGHILYGQVGNALSSEAAFDYDDGINRLNINGSLNLGDVGVILSQSLGTLTFTGLSGTAEDLTVDLATANNISFTSSTGVATATWSGINLVTPLASTTATSTFHGLTFTGKSCAGLANSGKLTLNSLGQVICLDDTSGGGGGSGTIEFEIANNVYSQSSLRPTTTQNLIINGAGTSTFAGGLEIGRQIAFPYLHSTSTATSTFAGDISLGTRAIWGHSIFGDASDGLFIKANNGTQVANLGAGNSANATFYGGVNIDGQTRIATSISGVLKAASGVVSAAIAGVDYLTPSFRDWSIVGGSLTPTTTIGITVQASSTIQGLTMARSTTTNATTTSLNVLTELKVGSITGLLKGASGIISQAIDGVDFISPNFRDWNITGGSLAPTSTRGILVQAASSTINGLTINVSTTTSATTTNLSIGGGLTFNGVTGDQWADFCVTITGAAGLCDGDDATGSAGVDRVATSSAEAATQIPYWTSTAAAIATLSGGENVFSYDSTLNKLSVPNASTTDISAAGNIIVSGASSSIRYLYTEFSTSTNATTTNFSISGGLTFNGVTADTWAEFCTTITGSAGLCDGNDASGGGSFTGAPHALVASVDGTTLTSTSTPNFSAFNATSTTATSTIAGGLSVGSSTPDSSCFFCVGTSSPLLFASKDGRIGFGEVNNGPTRFTFGNGVNANLNPNIMFLVQDAADARMGVSVGDDFIGMKSAGGAVGIFGFDYASGLPLNINMQEFGGNVGIATSSPYAKLSVVGDVVARAFFATSTTNTSIFGSLTIDPAATATIPQSSNPTVNAVGQIGFDTTDNQFLFGTTTSATPAVIPSVQKLWGATIASSSVDFVSGGRIWLPPQRDGFTVKEIHCAVDGGTSVVINLSNSGGTTDSETLTCDADGAIDTAITTNPTYASGSLNSIEIGTITGTVDYVTFSIWGTYTRE